VTGVQTCALPISSVEKQGKRLYVLKSKKSEGTAKCRLKLLIKKIKNNIPQKPRTDNLLMEISSKCAEFIEREDGEFDGFINLKSLSTKPGTHIIIPIKFNRHSNKLKDMSLRRLNSFLIGTDTINIRWEIPVPELKSEGEIVGGDQGMKTVLTLANMTGTVMKTPEVDIHGHSLESIMDKMCRKRKGSRAFKRAQSHRTNFTNWSMNQFDLKGIKQINFEKIWNLGFKSSKSRKMSHWTNTSIADKVERLCNENGVRLVEESSTYMSQRCSVCGLVRKANRKGKQYVCKSCGFTSDADENAARNHTCELPEIPWTIRKLNLNRGKGFYWSSSGIYDLTGGSIESPLPAIKVNSY
jgi:transposase